MSQVFAPNNIKLLAENGLTLNEEAISYTPIYSCQRWSIPPPSGGLPGDTPYK